MIKHKEVDSKINQEMYRDVLNKMNNDNLSLDQKKDLGLIHDYRNSPNLKNKYDKFLKDNPNNKYKRNIKYIMPTRSRTLPQEEFRSRERRDNILADTSITPFAVSKNKKIANLKKKMTIQNYIKEKVLQETILPTKKSSEGIAFDQFKRTRRSDSTSQVNSATSQVNSERILPRKIMPSPQNTFFDILQPISKKTSKSINLPTEKLFLGDDYVDIRQQNVQMAEQQTIIINEIINANNLMVQVDKVKVLLKTTLFIIPLNYQINIFHFYNLINVFKERLDDNGLEIKYENQSKQNIVIEIANKYQVPLRFSSLIPSFQKKDLQLLALIGIEQNSQELFCLNFQKKAHYLICSVNHSNNEKFVNNIIFSLILKNDLSDLRFCIFDLNPNKLNSLKYLNGFPYLVAPVFQEMIPAIAGLDRLIAEMRYRLYLMETLEVEDFQTLEEKLKPDDKIPYISVVFYKLEYLILTDAEAIGKKLTFLLENAAKTGFIIVMTTNETNYANITEKLMLQVQNVIAFGDFSLNRVLPSNSQYDPMLLKDDKVINVDFMANEQSIVRTADLPLNVAIRAVDYVKLNFKTNYISNFINLFQNYKPALLNLDKQFLRKTMYAVLKERNHFNLDHLLEKLPETNPNQIVRILHFLEMIGNLKIDTENEGYFYFQVS